MPISARTETTDENANRARGWIFYDGECVFCSAWVRRLQAMLGPRGFEFVPLQAFRAQRLLRIPERHLLSEMRVLLRNGKSFGGADAIMELARYVWWAWPLVALVQISGMRRALRAAYRRVAARRSCLGGSSKLLPQVGDRSYDASASDAPVRRT
jgi:predicted DCC family thiol-disulfide oxidoreductase YuxK